MTDRDPGALLELAETAARRAGELLLERFAAPARGVATKSTPTDLVSDADRDAEKLLLDLIREHRPGDAVVAEESRARTAEDESSGSSGLRWIVDPLDGTVNFLFGIPVWAVSIAVEDRDGGLVGVVHDPSRRETFTATRGGGAYLNGTPIYVGGCEELSGALVGTGFSYDARIRASQAAVVSRLLPEVRDIRRAGSAALDLAWLACGRLDGFYEAPMEIWDRAAGVLIIREAGGVVGDLAPRLGSGLGVVAANPALHAELVARVE